MGLTERANRYSPTVGLPNIAIDSPARTGQAGTSGDLVRTTREAFRRASGHNSAGVLGRVR